MESVMGFDFAIVLVFFAVGIGFVLMNLLVGKLLRPKFPDANKSMIYECGEVPVGEAWFNFNPRFYVVAIVFVVFEVEVALMLPVLLVYRDWIQRKVGGVALLEISAFIVIFGVGLVWIWARGDLDWVRTLRSEQRRKTTATQAQSKAA
jgi:NADH-quinone oxidoreductase subunit A